MAAESSIEIFQRTLLKLLIRRGTNAERTNIVLSEGELGYTTDTNKLYIGDGSTVGGVQVTGSKFLGSTGDLTTLAPADLNDMAFNTSDNGLYYIASGTGISIDNWVKISAVYTNADGTIDIDTTTNSISLGDAAGLSIVKDVNNKLTLDSTIKVDAIEKLDNPAAAFLRLPQRIALGTTNYIWPTTGAANTYLKLGSGGALTWGGLASTATSYVNAEVMPVGTILPFVDTVLPSNGRFLRCDGSYVRGLTYPELSATLGSVYGPLSTNAGSSYVKLPDLRGKSAVGFDNSLVADLSGNTKLFTLGSTGGLFRSTLSASQLPLSGMTYTLSSTHGNPVIGGTASWIADASTAIETQSPYVTTNYIIKALPDPIASATLNIFDSISASRNGINVSSINPLSGTYSIGLDTIITGKNQGYFRVNNKGLVTQYDTSVAGDQGNIPPVGNNSAHSQAFINYLRNAVTIVSDSIGGLGNNWTETFEVYPAITDGTGGNASPSSTILEAAKNVIIDWVVPPIQGNNVIICAAPNASRLGGSGTAAASSEYLVYRNEGDTRGNHYSGQLILPLEYDSGVLKFAMRGVNTSGLGITIRIIGWTL